MSKVNLTKESIVESIGNGATSISGIWKSIGGKGNISGSTVKKIKALLPDIQDRLNANKATKPATDSSALPTGDVRPTDFSMPEAEAARALRCCGISAKSLRAYAEANEIIGMKNGEHFYSRSFISDLSRNWLTKQQVMKKLKFGGSRFYVWKKARGIEPVVIGKISLVKASDVIEELKK